MRIHLLLPVLFMLFCAYLGTAAAALKRPNLLFIISDDHAVGALGT